MNAIIESGDFYLNKLRDRISAGASYDRLTPVLTQLEAIFWDEKLIKHSKDSAIMAKQIRSTIREFRSLVMAESSSLEALSKLEQLGGWFSMLKAL